MLKLLTELLEKEWKGLKRSWQDERWVLELLHRSITFEELLHNLYHGVGKDIVQYRQKYYAMVELLRQKEGEDVARQIKIKTEYGFVIYPLTKEVKVCGSDYRFSCQAMDSLITRQYPLVPLAQPDFYKVAIKENEDKMFGFYREPSIFDHIHGFFKEGTNYYRRTKVVSLFEQHMRKYNLEHTDGYTGMPPAYIRCIVRLSSSNKPTRNKRLVAVAREELKTLQKSGLVSSTTVEVAKETLHSIATMGYLPKEAYELTK